MNGVFPRAMVAAAAITLAGQSFAAPAPSVDPGYVLEPGDVVEFAVSGIVDLGRKVQVDADGVVSLPLVGEVKAAGRPLKDVRADVASRLSSKQYRARPLPGQQQGENEIVWPDQISLTVSEYRPVYMDGDVAKPGAVAFRPGMDVRQALSLAGGYDILRFRMENPFLVASDIRGSYESAWIEFARDQAALRRLRDEVASTATEPETGRSAAASLPATGDLATDPPVAPGLLASIREAEEALKRTRAGEFDEKKAHAAALVSQDRANIDVLTKRRDAEAANFGYDQQEFNRIQEVFKSGNMPMTRVADARRIMLLSSTQALGSAVELAKAKSDMEVHRHDAAAVVTDRRVELLRAEQDARLKLADDRVRIQALGDKLLYTGALKSQLVRGSGGKPRLELFRNGAATGTLVGEGESLRPGDVVMVTLAVEGVPAGASTLK